jgi:hypothetical protein
MPHAIVHSRRHRAARLALLDPVADHQAIVRIDGTLEFPWDMKRALELALLRTFAVPRISGLLHRTGEFERRPQRRYDDTTLLIAEFVEHGYDSPRGTAAIAAMNAQHGRYRIRNGDLLYVLSTFIIEPARWIDAYGWRPLTDGERLAGFLFWRAVGERMGIADEDGALESVARLTAWSEAYEDAEVRYARSNALVGTATRDLLLGWYLPRRVRPLGARGLHALLDDRLLDAFGFPRPTQAERLAVTTALRARSRALRRLPARRTPVVETLRRHRSYPDGHRLEELGPPAGCPAHAAAG